MISVKNDGPMIKPEVSAHIFEPFYTTKSNGTGLGLAVVAAVAKVHQGDIQVLFQMRRKQYSLSIIPKYEGVLEPSESFKDEVRSLKPSFKEYYE